MALVAVRPQFCWPMSMGMMSNSAARGMSATANKVAFMGIFRLASGPGTSKTLSTGTIGYRTTVGTVFANGGTTVQIGLQDMSTSAGPPMRPDGVFDVSVTLTGGGGGITANAWNTATMNTGSKTVNDGDFLAVVFDMTARAGADVVNIVGHAPLISNTFSNIANMNFFTTAWQNTTESPSVQIAFDDGTLGWFENSFPVSLFSTDSWNDGTNPDERGLCFTPNFDCSIDGFYVKMFTSSAAADWTANLYQTPITAVSLIGTVNMLGEQTDNAFGTVRYARFTAAPINLTKGTQYGVTVRPTSATNVNIESWAANNTNSLTFFGGGTISGKMTRNNDTGNFSLESPATTMYQIGLNLSAVIDEAGGGGGGGSNPVIGGWH